MLSFMTSHTTLSTLLRMVKNLAFLDTPFTYEPLAWAIRKGDPDFMNFLNNLLKQMRGDGRYEKIYQKWFGTDEWLKDIQS